jgi:REP element-mobilizing transposase RayT
MDRYWLLSNSCYGNRLPGDRRGFVGRDWEHRPNDPEDKPRVEHELPGTPYDEDIPGLEKASRKLMNGPPIQLSVEQALIFLGQLQETARIRKWELLAVAIMADHFHIVAGVSGDPMPSKILGDFKSWGTRRLSEQFGEPASKTWWTERGSKCRLKDGDAIAGAVHYVLYEQFNPLITWSPETGLHRGIPPKP